MTWKIVRVLEGRCLFGMRLHVKGPFSVNLLADLILFTQPSAVCETAAKWIDSRARLQFRFFLNVFNCLQTTNLSRRNDRNRTGPRTLFKFRRNCLFTLSCCYQRCSLDHARQDASDLFFILRPWCNAIRVHTACMSRVRVICGGSKKTKNNKLIINKKY